MDDRYVLTWKAIMKSRNGKSPDENEVTMKMLKTLTNTTRRKTPKDCRTGIVTFLIPRLGLLDGVLDPRNPKLSC